MDNIEYAKFQHIRRICEIPTHTIYVTYQVIRNVIYVIIYNMDTDEYAKFQHITRICEIPTYNSNMQNSNISHATLQYMHSSCI